MLAGDGAHTLLCYLFVLTSTKLTRQRRTDRLGGVLQHSLTHWQCALDNVQCCRAFCRTATVPLLGLHGGQPYSVGWR